ncbi:hypothetical protein NDU88_001065 [Pleurodeles waltl]|uniref:Uncharacterized protein n=1 Tax=Pleurodeles waltl TaxID=8319 RepID=A0AAV7Q5Y7_PLEWA|nr:hypothetical protein NDU88_001065 [Pleurodeles waltl]
MPGLHSGCEFTGASRGLSSPGSSTPSQEHLRFVCSFVAEWRGCLWCRLAPGFRCGSLLRHPTRFGAGSAAKSADRPQNGGQERAG